MIESLFHTDHKSVERILKGYTNMNLKHLMSLFLQSKTITGLDLVNKSISEVLKVVNALPETARSQLLLDPLFSFWLINTSSFINSTFDREKEATIIKTFPIAIGGYALNTDLFLDGLRLSADSQGRIPLMPYGGFLKVKPYEMVTIQNISRCKKLNWKPTQYMQIDPDTMAISTNALFVPFKKIPGVNMFINNHHDWFCTGFEESILASFSDVELCKEYLSNTYIIESDYSKELVESISIIREVWPNYLDVLNLLVSNLITMKGRLVGHSTPYLNSIIFVQIYDDCFYNAENLIHESSHCLLDAVMTQVKILLNNDNKLYPSPWRKDLRPLKGILHATYVHLRIARFYEQLIDKNTDLYKRYEEVLISLQQGYRSLREYGEFSSSGQQFMNHLETEIDNLPKRLQREDERNGINNQ